MCGIAGIVSFDRAIPEGVIDTMSRRLAHRGPDDARVRSLGDAASPQVAMAFRRLAVLDPDPRAMQPMSDPTGRFTLVFNGEIYNFADLRRSLESTGPFQTTGDSEVLLRALASQGQAALPRLNGMFALALWDARQQTLTLARDRTGQKPLFYAHEAGRWFAFASEIHALLACPWVDRDIDPAALRHYLRFGYSPPGGSIFRSIRTLDPGGTLTLERLTLRLARYCPPEQPTDAGRLPVSRLVEQTRERVLRAVQRQLVSDVPLGCFLSGGIDSSIIALAMTRVVGDAAKVQTFSIGFDDRRYDETAHARRVADHLGTTHRRFVVTPDASADLPALVKVFGEPFADSSALAVHYLARQARQHVTVALAGDGGDELFGGYDRYRAIRLIQRLHRLPVSLRKMLRVADWLPGAHPKGLASRARRFAHAARRPIADAWLDLHALFRADDVDALLGQPDPDFERSLRDGWPDHPDVVRAACDWDRAVYLPLDLHTKVDRASMLHALEVRAPFMDVELLEFTGHLTAELLLHGGGKRLLRLAFESDLPRGLFARRKMGFAVPIGRWFRSSLRELLRDTLLARGSFVGSSFDRTGVATLIDQHQRGVIDHSQRLYALLFLELWHQAQKSW